MALFISVLRCLGNLKEKSMKLGRSELDFHLCDLCGLGKWLNCCFLTCADEVVALIFLVVMRMKLDGIYVKGSE